MIYDGVPIKYRYIPINIECDIFVTMFMCIFSTYLGYCSNSLMAIVDNEDGNYDHFDERNILYYAKWARDVYKQKETSHEVCIRWFEYVKKHKYTIDIYRECNTFNFEFKFSDHSLDNINKSITIYNSIMKKWRDIDFEIDGYNIRDYE